jgi:hypothetical protein
MKQSETQLNKELRMGAQHLSQSLIPEAGAIPRIPNIDIYGIAVPLNGIAGGDIITYVDFHERYDLDARINRSLAQGREDIARTLEKLKRVGGILVADVAGHDFTDAIRALLLHQVFHTAALYEMDLNGEITARLFEQINTRFFKSRTLRKLAADLQSTSFVTLLYGEISYTGRFRFISAAHPPPLVFSREYNRFVEISQDRLISYPPIGLQLSEDSPDARLYRPALGYKKRYTVNELNLMGRGDVLLLYTDGLLDPFSSYSQKAMEKAISRARDCSAKEICEAILESRNAAAEQVDDVSLVVIKYQ